MLALASAAVFTVGCSLDAQAPGRAAAPPGKDAVLQVLGLSTLAHDPSLHLDLKSSATGPGSYVVLAYVTAASSALANDSDTEIVRTPQLQPTLALLHMADGQLTMTAVNRNISHTGPAGEFGRGCRTAAEAAKPAQDGSQGFGDFCTALRLDLAPYRIAPGQTAIGVRTRYYDVYPAGEATSEDLTLYAAAGNQLKPVLSEEMSGSYEERGPNEQLTSAATLRVSPQMTEGHFDLLLRERDSSDPLLQGLGTRAHRETAERRFTWNGSTYVEAKTPRHR